MIVCMAGKSCVIQLTRYSRFTFCHSVALRESLGRYFTFTLRQNLGLCKQRLRPTIAQGCEFSDAKNLGRIRKGLYAQRPQIEVV